MKAEGDARRPRYVCAVFLSLRSISAPVLMRALSR